MGLIGSAVVVFFISPQPLKVKLNIISAEINIKQRIVLVLYNMAYFSNYSIIYCNVDAQYYLGVMSDNGRGVPQDYKQAVAWYRKAAEQGHAKAQHNLGIMYKYGQGVPQNYKKAAAWYRKAAEQGHRVAQNNLGVMYKNGQGVPQNYKQATTWYRKAAKQGYMIAQNNLGFEYSKY